MSVADKLLQVNQVKQDIKTAIENKGADLTGVDFGGYAEKIDEISLTKEEQTKTVTEPNFSSGNVVVTPDVGKVLTQVTVVKDNDLVPENIVKDVNIFGVVGTAETGGGGGMTYEDYFNYAILYYALTDNSTLFSNAWEHSLTVDPLEISATSTTSNKRGTAQYPNGATEGVIIPQGVESIGDYAFYQFFGYNQPLVIPNSVTSIGDRAFYQWTANSQPLVIPNSVTEIGEYVFYSWRVNNHPLVIPNSVTSIGRSAFYDWRVNNHPLVIPNSVTSIGQNTFSNWALVPYVEMKSTTPPTLASASAFANQNDAPIYVPDASVTAYKNATNWVDLADRIFSINDK